MLIAGKDLVNYICRAQSSLLMAKQGCRKLGAETKKARKKQVLPIYLGWFRSRLEHPCSPISWAWDLVILAMEIKSRNCYGYKISKMMDHRTRSSILVQLVPLNERKRIYILTVVVDNIPGGLGCGTAAGWWGSTIHVHVLSRWGLGLG